MSGDGVKELGAKAHVQVTADNNGEVGRFEGCSEEVEGERGREVDKEEAERREGNRNAVFKDAEGGNSGSEARGGKDEDTTFAA